MIPIGYLIYDYPMGTSKLIFQHDVDTPPVGATALYTEEQMCACKRTMLKKDVSSRKSCHQYYKGSEDHLKFSEKSGTFSEKIDNLFTKNNTFSQPVSE